MAYHSFYTRSYTLPVDLFTVIQNNAESDEILHNVFDSRYLSRDRVRLIQTKPESCKIEGYLLHLQFWALVHSFKTPTIFGCITIQSEKVDCCGKENGWIFLQDHNWIILTIFIIAILYKLCWECDELTLKFNNR